MRQASRYYNAPSLYQPACSTHQNPQVRNYNRPNLRLLIDDKMRVVFLPLQHRDKELARVAFTLLQKFYCSGKWTNGTLPHQSPYVYAVQSGDLISKHQIIRVICAKIALRSCKITHKRVPFNLIKQLLLRRTRYLQYLAQKIGTICLSDAREDRIRHTREKSCAQGCITRGNMIFFKQDNRDTLICKIHRSANAYHATTHNHHIAFEICLQYGKFFGIWRCIEPK